MNAKGSTNRPKCEVCGNAVHRYKCPSCLLKYCSVICFKVHKEKGPCVPKKAEGNANKLKSLNPTQRDTYYPGFPDDTNSTKDQVPLENLKMLGQSEELLNLLQNPHLRIMMQHLDKADDPARGMEEAMHEPIFLEFVDSCLKVVEPENANALLREEGKT